MIGSTRYSVRRYYLILFIVLQHFMLKGQELDTISIQFDQILLLSDTIYYGVNDSVIILKKGTDYDFMKNLMVRKPSYYEKKPHKKEKAKHMTNAYGRVLMGQIHSKKEELPAEFNPADNYYSVYKNRIIKKIEIEQVPVFDGNIFDTTRTNTSAAGRFLNASYQPTKERVIRNNLKFRENDRLDPRTFSDNERLLRELSYTEDARIQIIPVENSLDSVIILVIVKDRYPIGLGAKLNDYNAVEVEPYTRNFLGLGHKLGAVLEFDGDKDEKFGYGAYYGIDNFGGSFINGEIRFNRGLDKDFYLGKLSKPFLTTYTRFGGELLFERLKEKVGERVNTSDSVINIDEKYSMNLFDVWMGYSFLFRGSVKPSFLNFAVRSRLETFINRPGEYIEFNYPLHNSNLILTSLSFQRVSYVKTTKLVQYGTTEDIPVGINMSLTGGWQNTSYVDRPYVGIRINHSMYFQNTGVFSTTADFGTFHYKSDFEDVVTVLKLNYASPLSQVGTFDLRHLFQLSYNAVYNPRYLIPVLYSDYLMYSEGIDGYYGSENVALNYHPIFYAGYSLWGFRFSIDPFVDIGWINPAVYQKDKWDSYSVLGINLGTKNESLVFPALHLQFAYYINAITDEPRFKFKLVFRDIKIFKNFTELKPRIAEPAR